MWNTNSNLNNTNTSYHQTSSLPSVRNIPIGIFGYTTFCAKRQGPIWNDIFLQKPWLSNITTLIYGGDKQIRNLISLGDVNIIITDRSRVDVDGENVFSLFDKHVAPGPSQNIYMPAATLTQIDGSMAPFQIVNHFPNNSVLINKGSLVRSLHRAYSVMSTNVASGTQHVFDAIPVCYFLPGGLRSEADSPTFKQFAHRFSNIAHGNWADMHMPVKHCERNIWVVKSAEENTSALISYCNSLEDIKTAVAKIHGDCIIQKCMNLIYILCILGPSILLFINL